MNDEKVLEKLIEHDVLASHHEEKLDLLISKTVEHGERLERIEAKMATKDDFRHMLGLLEGIATDIKTIKDDHIFAIEWLKRIQAHIEKQDLEIQAIKLKLQMS